MTGSEMKMKSIIVSLAGDHITSKADRSIAMDLWGKVNLQIISPATWNQKWTRSVASEYPPVIHYEDKGYEG